MKRIYQQQTRWNSTSRLSCFLRDQVTLSDIALVVDTTHPWFGALLVRRLSAPSWVVSSIRWAISVLKTFHGPGGAIGGGLFERPQQTVHTPESTLSEYERCQSSKNGNDMGQPQGTRWRGISWRRNSSKPDIGNMSVPLSEKVIRLRRRARQRSLEI